MKSRKIDSPAAMEVFGRALARAVDGAAMIELIGDVGSGKTTLVKALAAGMNVDEDVQSPSFTLSRTYDTRDKRHLVHYDFYRLADPGIMASDLAENVKDPQTITVVEWADVASDVLPTDRLTVRIVPTGETTRQLTLKAGGPRSQKILESLV